MSIRLRRTKAGLVALCAARSVEQPGDLYLDDEVHHALAVKFDLDYHSEGQTGVYVGTPEAAAIAREESNNANRDWWDKEYGPPAAPEREPLKGEQEAKVAASHVAFLQKHPEYERTFGYGVLTLRLPGDRFEHYRYAADLNAAGERPAEREPLKVDREPGQVSHNEAARFANWYKEPRRPNCSKREIERIVREFAAYLAAERGPVAQPPEEG